MERGQETWLKPRAVTKLESTAHWVRTHHFAHAVPSAWNTAALPRGRTERG